MDSDDDPRFESDMDSYYDQHGRTFGSARDRRGPPDTYKRLARNTSSRYSPQMSASSSTSAEMLPPLSGSPRSKRQHASVSRDKPDAHPLSSIPPGRLYSSSPSFVESGELRDPVPPPVAPSPSGLPPPPSSFSSFPPPDAPPSPDTVRANSLREAFETSVTTQEERISTAMEVPRSGGRPPFDKLFDKEQYKGRMIPRHTVRGLEVHKAVEDSVPKFDSQQRVNLVPELPFSVNEQTNEWTVTDRYARGSRRPDALIVRSRGEAPPFAPPSSGDRLGEQFDVVRKMDIKVPVSQLRAETQQEVQQKYSAMPTTNTPSGGSPVRVVTPSGPPGSPIRTTRRKPPSPRPSPPDSDH